jgi:dihydropyrimidinase
MKTIIKNGTVVTASETYEADVLVEDGVISALGRGLSAADEIDASGLLVLPGAIDVHTHMEMSAGGHCSTDDFYTGSVAAACGGTTTILDFVEPAPGQRLLDALAARLVEAGPKAAVDYGFHMTINRADSATLEEMGAVVDEGLPSFKTYMAYAGLMLDDEALFRVLVRSREVGGRVSVHAENGGLIRYLIGKYVTEGKVAPIWHARCHPSQMEAEATGRAVDLAQLAKAPLYVVHVSAADSLARIRAAQIADWPVLAETCPQYLVLDESRYEEPSFEGAKHVMSPPLRTKRDQDALWQGLSDGCIQTVATDHCPYNFHGQKDRGRDSFAAIPNGVGGVETRLPLLYHHGVNAGRITLNRFVEVVSTGPARLFGLSGRKGSLAPGCDADIVLWDPRREVTITSAHLHQNVDYTPYEGFSVRGWPALTMLRGKVIVREGYFRGAKGEGRFLERKPD